MLDAGEKYSDGKYSFICRDKPNCEWKVIDWQCLFVWKLGEAYYANCSFVSTKYYVVSCNLVFDDFIRDLIFVEKQKKGKNRISRKYNLKIVTELFWIVSRFFLSSCKQFKLALIETRPSIVWQR